ncbi:sortase domain-containing protein [Methanobacterium sp. ACI-7]|uniref:sortase domain-containing protein n=1 Tax=unclassified Methanobacterium TaxID=2627676 RepID=UPI0039C426A6
MNKYLFGILGLLILAIFAFEPRAEGIGTNHFEGEGISFDYPNSWNITNGTGSTIASFSDSNGVNVKVMKFGLPPGYNLATHIQGDVAGTFDQNFVLTSKKEVQVNGTTAYKRDYTVNGTQQRKEVRIQKNNLLYSIILTAPREINENSLDRVISSIKINESDDDPKYRGWAQIVFPQFNQKWNFSSWSLNDAGAVKHLSGFYPGERGQLALIGHHTTHHAPFLNIKNLKPGNKVIINDYLTQKKYTYAVTGSEVRMGVKGVDIKYHATEDPELWLITCWPPGYSRGAYIVKCKLGSIEPLN